MSDYRKLDHKRYLEREVKAHSVRNGPAIGGPRNGVRLTASLAWDGFLYRHSMTHHYVWYEETGEWVWQPAARPALSSPQRNGGQTPQQQRRRK